MNNTAPELMIATGGKRGRLTPWDILQRSPHPISYKVGSLAARRPRQKDGQHIATGISAFDYQCSYQVILPDYHAKRRYLFLLWNGKCNDLSKWGANWNTFEVAKASEFWRAAVVAVFCCF